MSEIIETRVVRLEEKLSFLVEEAKEAKLARKLQYSTNEDNRIQMAAIGHSLAMVQTKLDGQTPTIEEFISIKQKVIGAGKIGKAIWAAGVFVIGVAYSSREAILHWFSK